MRRPRRIISILLGVGCQGSGSTPSPPTPIATIHSSGDLKTDDARRFYWVAKDPISHQAVLLHTDGLRSTDYEVASTWSPRVPRFSHVPRKDWTECFVGALQPPTGDGSLEDIRLELRPDRAVVLSLAWDLTLPESPYIYQCTESGPIRIEE